MSERRTFSSEDMLLLLLVRNRLTPDLREHASHLLSHSLNWSHILRKAKIHRVSPLLYYNLRELNPSTLPREARVELENRYYVNAMWSNLLQGELQVILARFSEAGIPAIPFKGIALAASLYRDISRRESGDIDILVPRERITGAFSLLLALGYKSTFAFDNAIRIIKSSGQFPLVRSEGELCFTVELHWSLWGPMVRHGLDDLWAEARPASVFGSSAYAPSPEWELLFLASHASYHHCWQVLKWLVDIHELCSIVNFDWRKVEEKATRFGLERMLRLTLNICYALFQTVSLEGFAVKQLPSWVKVFPNDPPAEEINRPTMLAFDLDAISSQFRMIHRPFDKLHYLLFLLLVPTSAERKMIYFSPEQEFFYYLVRPVNFACKLCCLLLHGGVKKLQRASSSAARK